MIYVTGVGPAEGFSRFNVNLIPGIGECFVIPGLNIWGGPVTSWSLKAYPAVQWIAGVISIGDLRQSHSAALRAVETERRPNMALTDPNGILAGQLTPTVRSPVGQLPSGALVLGMADFVVLNDPITGQGSNNAAKGALEHTWIAYWRTVTSLLTASGCSERSIVIGIMLNGRPASRLPF